MCDVCGESLVFQQERMILSVELHIDLTIQCLGNWVRLYGFVFTVLRIQDIVSRNVFKQLRKTVIK